MKEIIFKVLLNWFYILNCVLNVTYCKCFRDKYKPKYLSSIVKIYGNEVSHADRNSISTDDDEMGTNDKNNKYKYVNIPNILKLILILLILPLNIYAIILSPFKEPKTFIILSILYIALLSVINLYTIISHFYIYYGNRYWKYLMITWIFVGSLILTTLFDDKEYLWQYGIVSVSSLLIHFILVLLISKLKKKFLIKELKK